MFSPMSVGAFIYKSIVGTEEGEDDDTEREDAGEKEGSGSDSDGGTSADPPGLRESLKHTPVRCQAELQLQDSEIIIATTTVTEEYTVRKEEFSARLSALPLVDTVDGAEGVTTGDNQLGDGSGASNDSDDREITLPEETRNVINPPVRSEHETEDEKDGTADYELPEFDSEHDQNAPLSNDFGDRSLHRDEDTDGGIEQEQLEKHELDLDSDPDSDGDSSSTTTDETMSTVRENTENCQLESEDRNDFDDENELQNNEPWPSEDEEHVYIAPDLEFPFHKTNVELEQTVNVEQLLENLDRKVVLKPPEPKEERYSPRPISDDELENALKILRSGKPAQKRSWYSLDNVSISKPNRSFALYYGERRNSAGDDNEPSSPEGNGIVFSLTGISKGDKSRSHSAFEHLGELDSEFPIELSGEDSVFPRPASAPREFSLEQEKRTLPDDNPSELSGGNFTMATPPPSPPQTVIDDGPVKLRPVSPVDSNHQFPITNENPEMPVPGRVPDNYHYNPDGNPHENDYYPSMSNTLYHEDAVYPDQESTPEKVSYQPAVQYPPYNDTYSPRAPSPKADALPGLDSTPKTLELVDPPLPSPPYHSGLSEDALLPDPELAPAPIAFDAPSEPRSEPHPELVDQSPSSPPRREFSPEPTPEPQQPSATEATPHLNKNVDVGFPSEVNKNPDEFPLPSPVEDGAYIPHYKHDDLPPPPEDISDLHDQVTDKVHGENLEPEDSPMSPEPYISATVKHPRVFYPSWQMHPQDQEQLPKGVITEHEQHPVFSLRQKESALTEIENILPAKKTKPALPPKPNLQKQKAVSETPIRSSSVAEERNPVDLSSLDSNQPDEVVPDDSPMSPEPYISASVKFPTVFSMPEFESPVSPQAKLPHKGGFIEHEQFPVFSNVKRELAFAELENILPERKVPPKVAPKPRFKRQEEIVEPDLLSIDVAVVECPIDFSRLDRKEPSKEITPQPEFVPEKPLTEAEEKSNVADETTSQDDERINMGVSKPISNVGDLTYIPRDETTPAVDEASTQSQDGSEQEYRDGQTSSSDSEEEVSFFPNNPERNEESEDMVSDERYDDDSTLRTEDRSFPETFESFPGAGAPAADSNDDQFESPEFSSADEFVAEADIAIRKMSAARNAHQYLEITQSSSSSSEDSSASSDSDDSSYESAEEHTYIVTEPGEGLEEEDKHQGHGVFQRSLSQVIEEGEEEEEEYEKEQKEYEERYRHEDHVYDNQEEKEMEADEPIQEHEGEGEKEQEDDGVEHMITKSSDDEVQYEQQVTISVEIPRDKDEEEATQEQPEKLPDTEEPTVSPTAKPRYPKYVNFDRPMYDNKPRAGAEYDETVEQIYDLPHKTTEESPPVRKSPETLEAAIPSDENEEGSESSSESDTSSESDASSESDTSEKSCNHSEDDAEEVESEEREYREETMDFSSEYSDEPEWLPPPPSTGARVFVLTSNMLAKMQPSPLRMSIPQHHQEDGSQDEPRGTVRDVYRREDEDYNKSEDELESEQYFRPITEVAPPVSKVNLEETARPIPQYKTEEKQDIPQSVTSALESAPQVSRDSSVQEQKSKTQDVKTLTVTYTVIHTKPIQDRSQDGESDTYSLTQDAPTSDDKSVPLSNSQQHISKDEDFPKYVSDRPYKDGSPTSGFAESPREEYIETIRPEDASVVESAPSSGPREPSVKQVDNSLPSYGTDLDSYELAYRSSAVAEPKDKTEPEISSEYKPDDAFAESWRQKSKSVPVNEVGPYNYSSRPDQTEDDHQHGSRNRTVEKIELRPEVSLFTISPREPSSPRKKPTSPEVAVSSPADDTGEPGSYRYSSWYEEPKDETPAMAIALVKSDIRLPSEYISERTPAEGPKPAPKPTERPKSLEDRLESDEYRGIRVMWYDEPSEEKPKESEDVVIISSVEPQEESRPKKETRRKPPAREIALAKRDIKLPSEYISERTPAEEPKPAPKPTERPKSLEDRLESDEYRGIRVMWYDEPSEEKPKESEDVVIISSVEPQEESRPKKETRREPPAREIALAKRDIKLPSEYISERTPAEEPKPEPKPKERPKSLEDRLESDEYRGIRVMWYDEPSEEKPKESDDVVIISSVEPQEDSRPKEETPLSPEVQPGTYKYSAWYEEPKEEQTGGDYFVLSRPADEEPSKSNSFKTPVSQEKDLRQYQFSAWYDEPPAESSKDDYFVVSTPSASEDTSKPTSPSSRNGEDIFQEGLSRSALYEQYQSPQPAAEDSSATFVLSRPYEDTEIRPSNESSRPMRSTGGDLYHPQERNIDRNARVPSGNNLSVEGSVSGGSSRNNSSDSRTSGSLADVSATSGEAMRRTWSDESDEIRNGKVSSAFQPPVVQRVTQLPPQPKPRKTKPSAPSSSDDEQRMQQPRRPGRSERQVPEAKPDLGENLSPRAEYALASSSWRRIPQEKPRPPQESAIWDSGDDRRERTRPEDRGIRDNRYSVSEKPRKEIEQMLDSLVDDEDVFDRPQPHRREPYLPPQRYDDPAVMGQWRNDGSRSMNLLPQTQLKSYEFVETSFQETRFQSTSEPHIAGGFDRKDVRERHPDFSQPITVLRPRDNEPPRMPETRPDNERLPEGRGRQPVPRNDGNDGLPSSRDEYRLAAASWENMSSASDEGSFKRPKMETWDNDPDADPTQVAYSAALISKHTYEPERAPSFSEEGYARPRGPRRKGNGMVVTADVHTPYVPPPVPGDPQLAVQMLSASSSIAELAPPPPKDWGTPRKAHSTLGISQQPRKPNVEIILPDAEASAPRRHHQAKNRGLRPPPPGPKAGRSHSPVSIASYSSTQSLPARILPRLSRDKELEKLKHNIAEIGKLMEIKNAELRKIHTKNPSVRHHIPMRGPRGELISSDGRVLSTPEKPNRAELEKYKRFFDKLPEPHFRRLMHEMLEYKHMVKQKEEEIRRLNTQCVGLRRRLAQLAQQGK